MTPSEHERRLDQALDDLLDGDSDAHPVDTAPELRELLPIAHEVRSALVDTLPPPHGLRPGRSAFLTAAAAQGAGGSRFNLPAISRAWGWIAPGAVIMVFAIVLTGLFQNNIIPPGPSSFTQPQAQPAKTVSSTPTLFPAPVLVPPTASTSTKNHPVPTPQEPFPPVDQDIPSARTGRESPAAPASPDTDPPAETTQQPKSINSTPTETPEPPLPEPTSTIESMPTASVSTSEPEYTPTATLTTTPTLTPTVAPVVTKSPTPAPTLEITPLAPLTPEPLPITVTPPIRPSSTPGSQRTPSAPSPTPKVSKTPQVKAPTVTQTPLSQRAW